MRRIVNEVRIHGEDYLTAPEAAKKIGISVVSLKSLIYNAFKQADGCVLVPTDIMMSPGNHWYIKVSILNMLRDMYYQPYKPPQATPKP